MRFVKAAVAAGVMCVGLLTASSHRHAARRSGQAGVFDFYLLVLSWSPEFCHSHPTAAECSRHLGFIVHGLWPQNADGTYPSNCATSQPPPTNPSSYGDILPTEIIQHEWQQHGTCSGLSGDAYFALIREAYRRIRIPQEYMSPGSSFTQTARQLKQNFSSINSGLDANEMAVQLRGNYLNAIEFCLSKGAAPTPIACSNVRDARGGTFIVPPAR